jgi:hypothetical protein
MMSNPTNEGGKLQELIQKFGGWAGVALISLAAFMYQGDKASTQQAIEGLEKNIATNQRAISRLQDGKASRAELKELQEAWLRESQSSRQDYKDQMNILRNDIIQRLDIINKR